MVGQEERPSDEEDGKPQEAQRQRPKARPSSALPSGHRNKLAYVAMRTIHVSDIDGHGYKSLVSYKRHVGAAHTVLKGYSLTGLSHYSVNRISRNELSCRFDVDDDTQKSPDLLLKR